MTTKQAEAGAPDEEVEVRGEARAQPLALLGELELGHLPSQESRAVTVSNGQ